ncbi:MAG: glycosyltransferase family 39 protein [Planctomycetaceae bacterium]
MVAAFLALRTLAAWICPATIDEAYAIAASRGWSLSYFDHPPACFTLAGLMAWLTGREDVFVARIPFLLMGAATAWLVYDVARLAYGSAAGLWALAWHSVAPFFLVSGGHFVVPDGPLDLALVLTLRLVLPDLLAPERPPRLGAWCAAGAAFALAFASKYQAVLFGASALMLVLTSPAHRRLLAAPATWAALAISLVGLVPTVVWNATHGWVSLGFQAGRAGGGSRGLEPVNFLITLGGQMLYVLPGTWALALVLAARGIVRPRAVADRVFGWFTIVPPVVFLAIALVSRGSLPHWAMSGFLFGFPLVGEWTAHAATSHGPFWRRLWAGTALLLGGALLGYALEARHALLTRPCAAAAPAWGVDWQFQDWTALAEAWPNLGAAWPELAGARPELHDPRAVVVRNWTTGAKAGHALGPGVTVVPLADPRHFQFLPAPAGAAVGDAAIAVEAADPGQADVVRESLAEALAEHGWRVVGEPRVIDQAAGGQLRFHVVALPVVRDD